MCDARNQLLPFDNVRIGHLYKQPPKEVDSLIPGTEEAFSYKCKLNKSASVRLAEERGVTWNTASKLLYSCRAERTTTRAAQMLAGKLRYIWMK